MEKSLPKGWVKTEFANLIAHVTGGDWGKDSDFEDKDFEEVYCIRGSEIKNWNSNFGDTAVVRKIKKSSLDSRRLVNGDILLEISGGGPDQPVGRVVLITQNTFNRLPELPIVCTNFLRLIRPVAQINSSYFCSYLEYFYYSGEVVKYQGGSNNLRNLKYKEYETIRIPLPPLPEQERIVAKLDKLFAQQEKIKKALDRIPQLLKAFRQQVLTQAVTGKLTEQWREGKDLEEIEIKNLIEKAEFNIIDFSNLHKSWRVTALGNFAHCSRGKFTPRPRNDPKYFGGKYPFMQIGDLPKEGGVTYSYSKTLNDLGKNVSKSFDKNTVVIAIVGATIGNTGILNEKMYFPDSLIGINTPKVESNQFIEYFLRVCKYGIREVSYSSGGQPNINTETIKNLEIAIPSFKEQQEIARRVERLFAKADAIESRYQTLKGKIDNLPQAILHKAFRGELVPQLPSDGDAKDLLEEILALKKEAKGKKK